MRPQLYNSSNYGQIAAGLNKIPTQLPLQPFHEILSPFKSRSRLCKWSVFHSDLEMTPMLQQRKPHAIYGMGLLVVSLLVDMPFFYIEISDIKIGPHNKH